MSSEERSAAVSRRDAAKVRAADRARHERHRAVRLAAMKQYAKTPGGREALDRGRATWTDRNPEKRRAQVAVSNALRDGRLSRGPCEREGDDCDGRIEAHHDDYSELLEVRWLCVRHHRAADSERREAERREAA